MATPTPTTVPSRFVAGDTVKFDRSFPDYPASAGWAYNVYFNGAQKLGKAATTTGDTFNVVLTATDTATFTTPGVVRYQERVSKAGEVHLVGEGSTVVALDFTAAAAGAALTFEERTLAVIEAALAGRLTKDEETYQIAGRAVSRIPFETLNKLRTQFAAAVRYQRTGSSSTQILVEFGNPDTR
jgi:hypothetical protein